MNRCLSALLLAVPLLVVVPVRAQYAPRAPAGAPGAAAEQDVLRIRRLAMQEVPTPEYRTSVSAGVKPRQKWLEVMCTYEIARTMPWIDELTFQYYVLCDTVQMPDRKRVFSLYKETVRYSDIAGGEEHRSTVYLHPAALKRYGAVMAVAVEITYQGKVIAEAAEIEARARKEIPPQQWWKDPVVVSSPNVTVREGYLLSRKESPFALVNVDDYEFIK